MGHSWEPESHILPGCEGLVSEFWTKGVQGVERNGNHKVGAGFLAKKEWIGEWDGWKRFQKSVERTSGSTRMMFWEEHGERMVRTRPQRLKEQKAWEDAVREVRAEY